jgi:hypothetical protein
MLSDRSALIEGYKTNIPNGNGELTEEECKRAGVDPDPRLKYDRAGGIMLSDQLDEIMVSRELFEDETGEKRFRFILICRSDWRHGHLPAAGAPTCGIRPSSVSKLKCQPRAFVDVNLPDVNPSANPACSVGVSPTL